MDKQIEELDDRNAAALSDALFLRMRVKTFGNALTDDDSKTIRGRLTEIADRLESGFYLGKLGFSPDFGLRVCEDKSLPAGSVVFQMDGKQPVIVHVQPDDTEGGLP